MLGDAGDTVHLDLSNFEDLGELRELEGRRLYRHRDNHYGLEVDHSITMLDLSDER